MIHKVVNFDALAVLLILEKDLEPTPEVFRCQKNVSFEVPFHEYISFIELCLGQADLLATPSEQLHKLLREYRLGERERAGQELFSAFLKDMSFAVCKELYFAEASGKEATTIVHSANTGVLLTPRDIESYFANGAVAVLSEMLHRLSCKGYNMPKQISPSNAALFKYAAVMYFLSTLPPFYWSYQK